MGGSSSSHYTTAPQERHTDRDSHIPLPQASSSVPCSNTPEPVVDAVAVVAVAAVIVVVSAAPSADVADVASTDDDDDDDVCSLAGCSRKFGNVVTDVRPPCVVGKTMVTFGIESWDSLFKTVGESSKNEAIVVFGGPAACVVVSACTAPSTYDDIPAAVVAVVSAKGGAEVVDVVDVCWEAKEGEVVVATSTIVGDDDDEAMMSHVSLTSALSAAFSSEEE